MQMWMDPTLKLYRFGYGCRLLLIAFACTLITHKGYSNSYVNNLSVCVSDTTPGKATITHTKQITLSSEAPVKQAYVMDITHLAFANEAAAQAFFESFRDNLVEFNVDFKAGKAMMRLNNQYIIGAPWPVEKWNSYLAKKAKTVTN